MNVTDFHSTHCHCDLHLDEGNALNLIDQDDCFSSSSECIWRLYRKPFWLFLSLCINQIKSKPFNAMPLYYDIHFLCKCFLFLIRLILPICIASVEILCSFFEQILYSHGFFSLLHSFKRIAFLNLFFPFFLSLSISSPFGERESEREKKILS